MIVIKIPNNKAYLEPIKYSPTADIKPTIEESNILPVKYFPILLFKVLHKFISLYALFLLKVINVIFL